MLDAVAELRRDAVVDIAWALRDVEDADALGADEAGHALDLVEHGRARAVEEQVRLVEQKDELGLVEIADLGQLLEELREQPKQERRIKARRIHQPLGRKNIDDAATIGSGAQEIVDV